MWDGSRPHPGATAPRSGRGGPRTASSTSSTCRSVSPASAWSARCTPGELLGVDATATVRAAVVEADARCAGVRRAPHRRARRGGVDARARRRGCRVPGSGPDRRSRLGGQGACGRADHIRRCVGCNQGCYGNLIEGLPVTCVTNPVVGREVGARRRWRRPTRPRHVVVVGGGPAGLEAAWVAAARGHRVTLLERADELGGKIGLAASLPGRGELIDLARWRIGECHRRGVDLRCGVDADVEHGRSARARRGRGRDRCRGRRPRRTRSGTPTSRASTIRWCSTTRPRCASRWAD